MKRSFTHSTLFVLYVVLTFESEDKILWCDHSNEFFSAVLSHNTICFVCKSCEMKPLQQYFHMVLFVL